MWSDKGSSTAQYTCFVLKDSSVGQNPSSFDLFVSQFSGETTLPYRELSKTNALHSMSSGNHPTQSVVHSYVLWLVFISSVLLTMYYVNLASI